MTADRVPGLSANDRALLAEAMRRVQTNRFATGMDHATVTRAVSTAYRQGRRDLFGLVKAGCNAA